MTQPTQDPEITVFRVELPLDGTHEEVVTRARACGMRWTIDQAQQVVNAALSRPGQFVPALAYSVRIQGSPVLTLPGITYRIEACNRARIQENLGYVPKESRENLERLRDVCNQLANSINELLA